MLGVPYISAFGVRSCQLNVCVSWKFVEICPSSRLGLLIMHIHWPHDRENRCTLEVGRHERMLMRFGSLVVPPAGTMEWPISAKACAIRLEQMKRVALRPIVVGTERSRAHQRRRRRLRASSHAWASRIRCRCGAGRIRQFGRGRCHPDPPAAARRCGARRAPRALSRGRHPRCEPRRRTADRTHPRADRRTSTRATTSIA